MILNCPILSGHRLNHPASGFQGVRAFARHGAVPGCAPMRGRSQNAMSRISLLSGNGKPSKCSACGYSSVPTNNPLTHRNDKYNQQVTSQLLWKFGLNAVVLRAETVADGRTPPGASMLSLANVPGLIWTHEDRMSEVPCVVDTGVALSTVADWLEDGHTARQIAEQFPRASAADRALSHRGASSHMKVLIDANLPRAIKIELAKNFDAISSKTIDDAHATQEQARRRDQWSRIRNLFPKKPGSTHQPRPRCRTLLSESWPPVP